MADSAASSAAHSAPCPAAAVAAPFHIARSPARVCRVGTYAVAAIAIASLRGVYDPALQSSVPRLAPNIFVVPPESDMSTYVLMSLCNAAIIYSTKMGVELTSVGLPVIVAGEACPAALASTWSAGRRFVNAYGPTETTVCASLGDYTGGTMTIGRPMANVNDYHGQYHFAGRLARPIEALASTASYSSSVYLVRPAKPEGARASAPGAAPPTAPESWRPGREGPA